jgi:hypothetical protein
METEKAAFRKSLPLRMMKKPKNVMPQKDEPLERSFPPPQTHQRKKEKQTGSLHRSLQTKPTTYSHSFLKTFSLVCFVFKKISNSQISD